MLKPVRSVVLGTVDGKDEGQEEGTTSGEWLRRKYEVLRGVTWTADKDWVLKGVKEVPAADVTKACGTPLLVI